MLTKINIVGCIIVIIIVSIMDIAIGDSWELILVGCLISSVVYWGMVYLFERFM